ncbi:unnamed protein product [Rotaria sp. Silwood2]|nr:unnamed protein product [Rotaria sp. Silwood2]
MQIRIILWLYISLILIELCIGISSPLQPFTTYKHTVELQANVAQLWWTVNDIEQEITFELHVNTVGWIGLGISPAGGMQGADIAVAWVDTSGKVHIQDRFAFDKIKPILDNTTQDWFALRGQEQNGWTGIQFKRYFDTCDPMDVPIKSGTNILIFAYGLVDLDLCQSNVDITYHDNRRGSRILPLRSYVDQPAEDTLLGLETIDLRFNNTTAYPEETGYAVTSDTGSKYFMIKIHYDNPRQVSNLQDSSGIRFYLANDLRKYDLGYVLFGTLSRPTSLAIPPKAEQFIVDSYCPPEATRNFPSSGINIVSALPHTHLQGISMV